MLYALGALAAVLFIVLPCWLLDPSLLKSTLARDRLSTRSGDR